MFDRLEEMLKVIDAFPESMYFPLSSDIVYYTHYLTKQICMQHRPWEFERGKPYIDLNFQSCSLESLKILATWLEIDFINNRREELIEKISTKLIPYSQLREQIEEAMAPPREIIDEFRATFDLEKVVDKYRTYLTMLRKQSITIDSAEDVAEELKTAPATLELLLNLNEYIEELKKHNLKLTEQIQEICGGAAPQTPAAKSY